MVALTAARNTPQRQTPRTRTVPVAANAVVQQGGQAQINAAGYAVPATATVANITIGMAKASVNNTGGANGALTVDVDRGVFRFNNSTSTDLIGRTEIGANVYVVDDQTVAKTNGGGTRPVAGKCFDVDASGVWVEYL